MSVQVMKKMKKSAVGATTVTLVADDGGQGVARPDYLDYTQIVVTTPATPPSDFWGVATDGQKYEVYFVRLT